MTRTTTARNAAMARGTASSTGAPSGSGGLVGDGRDGLRLRLNDDGQPVAPHDADGGPPLDRPVVGDPRRPFLAGDVDRADRLERFADLADATGSYATQGPAGPGHPASPDRGRRDQDPERRRGHGDHD